MSATLLLFAAMVSTAIDQTTKALVLAKVRERSAVSFGPVSVRRVLNCDTGRVLGGRAAFLALWVLELVLLLALVEWTPRLHEAGAQVALGAAFGGATGNVVDRLWRDGVVDFIDVRVWPVFNFADVAIVAGALAATLALL